MKFSGVIQLNLIFNCFDFGVLFYIYFKKVRNLSLILVLYDLKFKKNVERIVGGLMIVINL